MSARGDFSGPSILILDCSTSRGSVALALGRRAIYWEKEFSAGRGHGGELFRALEEAVQMAKKVRDSDDDHQRELRESLQAQGHEVRPGVETRVEETDPAPRQFLSEILVGLGPGSYSGVRQAVAAASGLAMATGARLGGFASPLALRTDAGNYHAVGDARRGAFYHTAVRSETEDWTAGDGALRGTSVVARTVVAGPELLDGMDALHARLAAHPDWPVVAVESVPPGLPADTPVVWPAALRLPLFDGLARHAPPLEPIYLRPVSITLPKPTP